MLRDTTILTQRVKDFEAMWWFRGESFINLGKWEHFFEAKKLALESNFLGTTIYFFQKEGFRGRRGHDHSQSITRGTTVDGSRRHQLCGSGCREWNQRGRSYRRRLLKKEEQGRGWRKVSHFRSEWVHTNLEDGHPLLVWTRLRLCCVTTIP